MSQGKLSVFADGIPSFFVVGTPFQSLCAVEAINHFCIVDYEVFVLLFYNEKRIDQVDTIFRLFDIKYSIIHINGYSSFKFFIKGILKKVTYKRAFVGNYYSITCSSLAVTKLAKFGAVIYMDDGNSTISILKNRLSAVKLSMGYKGVRLLVHIVAAFKSISIERYFFSVYSDIKTDKFIVRTNDLSSITHKINIDYQCEAVTLFIGTNPEDFCKENHIHVEIYNKVLRRVLTKMNETGSKLLYIPHGLDNSLPIKDFCDDVGIEFIRPSVCVELFLISRNYSVVEAAGFSSSALFNIKKMYPEALVRNLRFISHIDSQDYSDIAEYYAQNGIINEKINVDGDGFTFNIGL
ncbi:MAG: hypothetical protein PHS38_07820 [Bacteroidales bacterium]|jgi:hypothetical protein|nr:hypothetical protein [Bacteroidales bacterium]